MDLRSRMVALFKVLLPLAALAILSTLFMLSRSLDPTATIPFAENEMADRMRDQQVTAPFFSGTTPEGDEITVSASLARPGGDGTPAEATNLTARLMMADGVKITMTSDTGTVDVSESIATFNGNVEITSSQGILVQTDTLRTTLNSIAASTPGTVIATTPFGDFVAGRMQLSELSDGGPLHMVFKDGVKLIYDPKTRER
ncbi:MAG: LPS export ABC transporter periplasmic protein LptC [Rhodobacteraceae bacterium]|nr:LPS export ABC transporter periplasmic protein LptC [Paracoccaceae bacterium]